MSEKIYRYLINSVEDGVQILRDTVYPAEYLYKELEVIDTHKVSVQDALHIVAGMNSVELTKVSSKIGEDVNEETKNKYIVGAKEWNVPELLEDIRKNNFLLRIDNHTVAYSNFDNKRRVMVTSLVHYQTELLTITSTEQGIETIEILIPDHSPAQAMIRRVNSVLGFYGWRLDRYEQNPDFELCVRRIGEHVIGGYVEGASLDIPTDVAYIPHVWAN